jgi:phospholipid transport system substrate-binding protein
MKRWWILSIVVLASVAFGAGAAGPGSQVVKQANDKISALLKQKADPGSQQEKDLASKVTTSVRDFLDIDELGKRAMVDQWSKLSAAQQQEFLATLRALIEDNYVRGLRSNLEYSVDYTGEANDAEGNLVVTTSVNTKRHNHPYKIEVDYVLKKDGDKWKAWDVKTDGVGLVDNYRTQFNKIIDHDGFSGLITKMKKKQGEEAAGNAGSGSGASAASKPSGT